MKFKLFLLFVTIFILSCTDESSDSAAAENNAGDFFPSDTNNYWKYIVSSSSEELPDMDFTALDSVYVAESFDNAISLAANDGSSANGRMNMILTSGNLYKTNNTLELDGSLDLSENFSALGLAENFSLTNLTLYDLEASNESIIFTESGTFSNANYCVVLGSSSGHGRVPHIKTNNNNDTGTSGYSFATYTSSACRLVLNGTAGGTGFSNARSHGYMAAFFGDQ